MKKEVSQIFKKETKSISLAETFSRKQIDVNFKVVFAASLQQLDLHRHPQRETGSLAELSKLGPERDIKFVHLLKAGDRRGLDVRALFERVQQKQSVFGGRVQFGNEFLQNAEFREGLHGEPSKVSGLGEKYVKI